METNLIKDYKLFEDNYNRIMPELIKKNYRPLSTKEIMIYKRKAVETKDGIEINFWLDHHFDTPDGLIPYKDHIIVIPYSPNDPDSQLLVNANENSDFNFGALRLTENKFNYLAEKYGMLKRDDILFGRRLLLTEAKQHQVWFKLTGADKNEENKIILYSCIDYIFKEIDLKYEHYDGMSVSIENDKDEPLMYAFNIGVLDHGSNIVAWYDLKEDDSRIIAVPKEKNLEMIVNVVL